MTRRLVPLLFVALVVLAGCAGTTPSPATDATGTQPPDATTAESTRTTASDDTTASSTTTASGETDAAADTPPGVDPDANASGVVANASALVAAHEDALLADGFRARVTSTFEYGNNPPTSVTGRVTVGSDADRFYATVNQSMGNTSSQRALFGNRSFAATRIVLDGEPRYRHVERGYLVRSFTGTTMLEGAFTSLNFSVANVSTRDGTTYYTLEGSRTNASMNASADARVVVDETGVVHAYQFGSESNQSAMNRTWTLTELGATPERPAWVADVSRGARLNLSVYASVQYDKWANPNGTGYSTNHGVLVVRNSGPDAVPAGANVSITSNGTTYTAVLDEPLPGEEARAFARVDGELTARDTIDAFDDPPDFAENVTIRVSLNETSLYQASSSYGYRSSTDREDRDDAVSANATQYAPGVTSDGIVYAERLLDAHTESLVASGFEVTGVEESYSMENGTVDHTSTREYTVLASTNRTSVLERVADEDGRVVEHWKDGRYRYVHTGDVFGPREGIDVAQSLAVPVSMERALEVGDFEVTGVEERANGTFVTLEATSGEADDPLSVESFDATVVVDADGRIHRFESNVSYVLNRTGDEWGGSTSFELVRTGNVDPERPGWMTDVPANVTLESHVFPRVHNGSQVLLEAYGGDAVPAGTTLVVTVDGERYETTLDEPLESREKRYAAIVDGELRVSADAASLDGEALHGETSVRLVTTDGVLLVDGELDVPEDDDGNATATPTRP